MKIVGLFPSCPSQEVGLLRGIEAHFAILQDLTVARDRQIIETYRVV